MHSHDRSQKHKRHDVFHAYPLSLFHSVFPSPATTSFTFQHSVKTHPCVVCLCSVQAKAARVEDDRVHKLPGGANLISCDGKSCSHEVAWPPGQGVSMTF